MGQVHGKSSDGDLMLEGTAGRARARKGVPVSLGDFVLMQACMYMEKQVRVQPVQAVQQ